MSAGCVRLVLSYTVRAVCGGGLRFQTPASRFNVCSTRSDLVAPSWRWSPLCTAAGETEQTPGPKKKKPDPRATIDSVGRKIPQRHIQVISDTGENLGPLHRADVIRIMDEKGLRLVLINKHDDPPVYQLMSGKQIHEEQMKLREKKKVKAASVQVKALTFSSGITAHDLSTKLKQVESWLEKKNHVRITLQSRRRVPTDNLDTALEQMVQQMGVKVGFISKPKVIREGQAAVCILRLPSAKELSQQNTKKKAAAPQSADPSAGVTHNETVSNANTTEESTIPQ